MPNDLPLDPVARINELRRRVIANEEVSQADLVEAIALIRTQRTSSAVKDTTTKSGKKKMTIPLDLNELFKPKEPQE